jgi:hypothetical protein
MIMEVPVRRLLALVTALAVMFTLAAVPAHAAVTPRIRDVRILSPGATTKIEVAAYGDPGITKVRAVVYPYSDGSPQTLTVDDFELVEGTATDGVWRTKSAVTVEQGRWMTDIELTTAEQTVLWRQRATIDNGLDTAISDVEVTPTTIDAENTGIVFRARLTARTASGDPAPVAGATLRLARPDGQTATAVTGADGRAEGATDFIRSGDAVLTYGGAFLYRPSKSAAVRVTQQRLKTRLTMNLPDRLIVGDRVPVTGRLERQDRDGVWGPLAGKQLDLKFNPATGADWTTIANPVTGANGDYTVQALVTGTGAWEIEFANDPVNRPDDYHAYESSYADSRTVRHVAYRTSITGFNATPEPVGRGDTVTAYVSLKNMGADGRWGPFVSSATVHLQFSADRKTWTTKATVSVTGESSFRVEGRADRDGYWRAVVPRGDYTEPATSGDDYVDVRYRTKILDFNAAPEPVKKGGTVTVMGSLYRETDKWKPYASKTIKFYFLPKGSSTWTYLGSQTTDKYGRFRKGFKASKDGTWRAYSGAATSYIKTYRDDYVDVR